MRKPRPRAEGCSPQLSPHWSNRRLSSFPLVRFDGEARCCCCLGGSQRPQMSRPDAGRSPSLSRSLCGAHLKWEDVRNRDFAVLGDPVGERDANKAVAGSSLRKEKSVKKQGRKKRRERGERKKKKTRFPFLSLSPLSLASLFMKHPSSETDALSCHLHKVVPRIGCAA